MRCLRCPPTTPSPRGTTVTITGTEVDDSYTPEDSGRVVRRTQIEAADIAVSLRAVTVTVTVTRKARTRDGQPSDTTPTPHAEHTDPATGGGSAEAPTLTVIR